MKIIGRIFPALFAVVVLTAVALSAMIYRGYSAGSPPYSSATLQSVSLTERLRTDEEHDVVRRSIGDAPYIVKIDRRDGALLFFGAHHTADPRDPQMQQIESAFASFHPTVVLYEGRQRNFVDVPLLEPLKGLTEVEKTHALAARHRVRTFSLEPSYDDEVAALLRHGSAEQVALYLVLRGYWSESHGKANEALAMDLAHKRTSVPPLRNTITSIADLDRIWKREYPKSIDWRTATEPRDGVISTLVHASRVVRNEHMARTMIELVNRGERVFAVAGSGNVIRTEWMLRGALDPGGLARALEKRDSN